MSVWKAQASTRKPSIYQTGVTMELLSNKTDVPGPENDLPAPEWNQAALELENAITSIGQSLSNGDLEQVVKAISDYSAIGDFYTDSGTSTAYVLTTIGSRNSPPSYVNGMRIRFRAGNDSTVTNPTVNVATIGVQNILNEAGGALLIGDIDITREVVCIYDGTDFRLQNYSGPINTAPELLNEYITGLHTTWVSTNSVSIGVGQASNEGTATHRMVNSAAKAKLFGSVWTAGTGVGGRAGSLTASHTGWAGLWMIGLNNGTTDFGYDLTTSATQLLTDSSYDHARRIGYVLLASGLITEYFQDEDDLNEFVWDIPVRDFNSGTLPTTRTALTLSAPPLTLARFEHFWYSDTGSENTTLLLITRTGQTDTAPSSSVHTIKKREGSGKNGSATILSAKTDTSSNILRRYNANITECIVMTFGWRDMRGQQ